jgi:plastocyanin
MKKVPVALILVLLASFALAACGSSSSSDSTGSETAAETTTESAGGGETEASGGGSAALKIEAVSSGFEFTSDTAESEAGEVTLEFDNPQSVPHNVAIEDSSGKKIGETETLAEGEATTVVDLKPGTYTYFCSIPGHREGGMEGTLTVK